MAGSSDVQSDCFQFFLDKYTILHRMWSFFLWFFSSPGFLITFWWPWFSGTGHLHLFLLSRNTTVFPDGVSAPLDLKQEIHSCVSLPFRLNFSKFSLFLFIRQSPQVVLFSILSRVYNCSFFFFFKVLNFYLFIYLWLCWVSASVRGPSPAAASGGHSSSRCAGLSLSRPLLLRSTGSRRTGSAIVAHGPSYSAACGILPDQGPNPCPLHWQADSQPLHHQGSPIIVLLLSKYLWHFKCQNNLWSFSIAIQLKFKISSK